MKYPCWPIVALGFFLIACQPQTTSATSITLIDEGQARLSQANERVPLLILTQAGLTVSPNDRIYLNGIQVPLDTPLPSSIFEENGARWMGVLQLRRPVALTITTPQETQVIQSTALTVGEALREAGIQLYASSGNTIAGNWIGLDADNIIVCL